MIDRDIIEAKFDIIERNLKFIRENYFHMEPEELEKDYRDYQALKFSLFEIVEACIDVANHIIASKRLERVEEYSRMFMVLGKNGIISEELAERLSRMARFRNFLIHRYSEVDAEIVMEIVRKNLDDVIEFMNQIKKFIVSQDF
ncbi:MAG: hypothetical protein DRP11_02900 [Candidatus Aenigmatarchaeota archaeon]|nr:MAG: hypothetical protein DRP11_02900 [Candidatus Aenigmarchaeota archaeon]